MKKIPTLCPIEAANLGNLLIDYADNKEKCMSILEPLNRMSLSRIMYYVSEDFRICGMTNDDVREAIFIEVGTCRDRLNA